jgi:Putative zinc-finger
MDHQEAIRLGAVEKYLLDGLEPPQRAEFEEHFFGCPECATDLRVTDEFLDTARKELGRGTMRATTRRTLKRSWIELFWRPPVLAPAFTLLLGLIVYQNEVVMPRFNGEIAQLRRPGVVPAISLIGGNSRGVASLVPSSSASHPFLLSLDIPATQQYSSYACVLVDSSGTAVLRIPVSAAQAQDTVSISVPAGNLRPGDYLLVVQGVAHQDPSGGGGTQTTDLARYRFNLKPSIDH